MSALLAMRLLPLLLLATLPAVSAAQAGCTRKGVERWDVKTLEPKHHARVVPAFTAREFGKLADPPRIDEDGQKNLATRYEDDLGDGLHEGDLVRVRGFVQLIKTAGDDCDYHIQLTPTKGGTSGTVIVEMPKPDANHITDPRLRAEMKTARAQILEQLNLTKEPSGSGNKIGGRAYMEFEGALFFDGTHYPHCDARGSGTPAVTCWELHPVTRARFVPKP